ncbi:MAG: ABC transporter ATP-binding protein, partial [Chloroflexi bacterium]|nr:ABC transporter ATP-binding protein [Chloroflexota bacterium]
MDQIFVVQDLKKHYGDVRAVNGISFSVEPGVIFAMLGPNGAGKSTTVEILEGLRERDSGYVSVLGLDPGRQQDVLSERIGIQLQSSALFPKLSAREHLQMFGSFYRNAHDVDELLDMVGLTERQKAYSENLSGGQQQRLAVALALLSDPELVFLDEPTTGLDPQARRRLWEVVTQMKERGTTVFLTTHFMDEAETLA